MNKLLLDRLKDTSIFLGWIAGLLLISGFCWFLSRPLRVNFLMSSINNAFTQSGDTRRLTESVTAGSLSPGLERLGTWYNLNTGNKAIVFTLIADGIFMPCMAVLDSVGKVQEIIPLSSNGSRMLTRISPGIIQLYIRRIEDVYE